jgi:conjugative transfer signal peptidase TraF
MEQASTMRGRLGSIRQAVSLGIILCASVFQICGWLGVRINLSPSLPPGLYLTSAAGSLIEFCPAEPFARLALLRGYRNSGVCADGGAPLLKPMVAAEGDTVVFSSAGFDINGVRIPNTAPLAADTKNRPLNHWPFGTYTVDAGTVWVASTYNARSLDSRYFGPVPIWAIRDRVRPILTF